MLLLLQHPGVALRDCSDCFKYVYDERTGERQLHRGQPLDRPPGTYPPCAHGRCKKGSPDAFKTLLPHNWQAYEHYLECKATSHFPDDEIVRRNAKIIKQIEDGTDRVRRQEEVILGAMGAITSAYGKRQ